MWYRRVVIRLCNDRNAMQPCRELPGGEQSRRVEKGEEGRLKRIFRGMFISKPSAAGSPTSRPAMKQSLERAASCEPTNRASRSASDVSSAARPARRRRALITGGLSICHSDVRSAWSPY